VDSHVYPLNFPIEGIQQHFKFKSSQQDEEDSCFPFHATCWELYSDYSGRMSMEGGFNDLFTVLNSMWYNNGALSWVHEYGGAGPFQGYRWLNTDTDSLLMANPRLSSEDLWNENEARKQLAINSAPKALDFGTRALPAHDPFWILPCELTSEILLHLSSTDILNLRLSSRKITLTKLPMEF
jgi:hypothetical protein